VADDVVCVCASNAAARGVTREESIEEQAATRRVEEADGPASETMIAVRSVRAAVCRPAAPAERWPRSARSVAVPFEGLGDVNRTGRGGTAAGQPRAPQVQGAAVFFATVHRSAR